MNAPIDRRSVGYTRESVMPFVGLGMVGLGLVVSLLVIGCLSLDIIHVAWKAKLLPRLLLFGHLPFCIISLAVSIVAYRNDRTRVSIIAIVLGIVGTMAAAMTFLIVIVVAIARNPV